MTYRIYWSDLDDYSGVQGESLAEVIEHAEACGSPYIIECNLPYPYYLLPVKEPQ